MSLIHAVVSNDCCLQGRKKSTDQGGTAVGAVAPAVAAAALSRKAPKQLVDFYRFQARDRRRNGESDGCCVMQELADQYLCP